MTCETIVHVADADDDTRSELARTLIHAGITAQAHSNGADLLKALDPEVAGCALVEAQLPDMSAFDVLRTLTLREAQVPVILTSRYADAPLAVNALYAGAVDVLRKPIHSASLLTHVELAFHEGARLRERRARQRSAQLRFERLTPREREVAALLVQGWISKRIAVELGVSVRTIEAHRAHILKKMEISCIVDLTRILLELDRAEARRQRSLEHAFGLCPESAPV